MLLLTLATLMILMLELLLIPNFYSTLIPIITLSFLAFIVVCVL